MRRLCSGLPLKGASDRTMRPEAQTDREAETKDEGQREGHAILAVAPQCLELLLSAPPSYLA